MRIIVFCLRLLVFEENKSVNRYKFFIDTQNENGIFADIQNYFLLFLSKVMSLSVGFSVFSRVSMTVGVYVFSKI